MSTKLETFTEAKDPAAFLPLKQAVYQILLALGNDEMHGYGVMQALAEKTGGRERILPGTLYASIARMVEDGLVEELEAPVDDASGGPQRRYYRTTAFGNNSLLDPLVAAWSPNVLFFLLGLVLIGYSNRY